MRLFQEVFFCLALPTFARAITSGDEAAASGGSSVAVTFAETATTVFGDDVFLTGSIPELSNWDPASAIPLSSASYPVWTVTLDLPASTSFEFKFIKKTSAGSIVWESDPNRQATTNASGNQNITTTFR